MSLQHLRLRWVFSKTELIISGGNHGILFKSQLSNVVEWEEYRDDCIFWKWTNKEIKKGSRLIIRPGQDAIFLYNGSIEGIFKDEGEFDIDSQIISIPVNT